MLLCGALDDPALGYEFGKLAVAMNDRFDDIALKSRVIYLYAMFVMHWIEHWSNMTPWFRRGIEAGYQSGDLLYLAYSAQDCVIWDPRLDLDGRRRGARRSARPSCATAPTRTRSIPARCSCRCSATSWV